MERLQYFAENSANKPAVVDKGQIYQFGHIYKRALEVADFLKERKLNPNLPVILDFDPSVDGVISMYGCLIARHIFVPISNKTPSNFRNSVYDQINPEITLSGSGIAVTRNDKKTEVVETQKLSRDIAAIIFTSGTSGVPKGVLIPYKGMELMTRAWENELHISKYKNYLVVSDFALPGFLDDMLLAHNGGGTMHITDEGTKRDVSRLVNYINENKIDFLDFSPAYARQITRYLENYPGTIDHESLFIVGSESWFIKDAAALLQAYPKAQIVNSYGLTESMVDAGIFKVKMQNIDKFNMNMPVPIGKPFGDTEFVILDDNSEVVEVGQKGELCIVSGGLALGYLNPEHNTNFQVVNGKRLVHTGDMVHLDQDGLVYIDGRKNDLVKIQGRRIDIKQVEQFIYDYTDLGDIAVIYTDQKGLSPFLTCFFTSTKITPEDIQSSVSGYLRSRLNFESLPIQFVHIGEIPMRSDGKTSYSTLRILTNSKNDERQIETDNNNEIYNTFKYCLGQDFDVNIDIFIQGADSLAIEEIRLVLEEKSGIKIPTRIFYSERTFNNIFEYIKKNNESRDNINLTVRDLDEDIKLPQSVVEILTSRELTNNKDRDVYNSSPILLTGSTGFLGIHLLHDLIHKNGLVYCLVRSGNEKEAFSRLSENWKTHFNERFPDQDVIITPGDFSEHNLGLPQGLYNKLSATVKGVIHAGYWVNFLLGYQDLRKVNVEGTNNLLKFATQKIQKPLAFISSSSTAYIQPDDLIKDHDGYELSKYISEEKLNLLHGFNFPYSISAPGLISPSTLNPILPKRDFFWSFIESSMIINAIPKINWQIDLVPVNAVAEILIEQGIFKPGGRKIISNYSKLTLENIKEDIFLQTGKMVESVSMDEWLYKLRLSILSGKTLPIRTFLNALEEKKDSFFDTLTYLPSKNDILYSDKTSAELFRFYLERLFSKDHSSS